MKRRMVGNEWAGLLMGLWLLGSPIPRAYIVSEAPVCCHALQR
jgi:hypothetical protein